MSYRSLQERREGLEAFQTSLKRMSGRRMRRRRRRMMMMSRRWRGRGGQVYWRTACYITFKKRISFKEHMKRGAHLMAPGPAGV